MPIRPENRGRYPGRWPDMVREAWARSGGQCECKGQCGNHHPEGRCTAINGAYHPVTGSVVVLTLAHQHGVPLEETNIGRMFQRCHNCYDAPMRRKGIIARARETLNNLHRDLFDGAT